MSTSGNIATAALREVLDDNLLKTNNGQEACAAVQSCLEIHEKYHSVHALLAVAAYSPSYFLGETCRYGYLLDQELSTHCVAVFVRKQPLDVRLVGPWDHPRGSRPRGRSGSGLRVSMLDTPLHEGQEGLQESHQKIWNDTFKCRRALDWRRDLH